MPDFKVVIRRGVPTPIVAFLGGALDIVGPLSPLRPSGVGRPCGHGATSDRPLATIRTTART